MHIEVLKPKLHRVRVAPVGLHYVGLVRIDEDLLDAASFVGNEEVILAEVHKGGRFETCTIRGARGSGVISLNGPAARLVAVGDGRHHLPLRPDRLCRGPAAQAYRRFPRFQ